MFLYGLIPDGLVIDHINDIRDDNRLSNLQMMTTAENNKKAALNKDYSLIKNNFINRKTIAKIEAKIMIHKPLHFKHMKVGALKLDSYFLDKQFPIKQRGDNTCMIDFIWHQCHNKKGFRSYTY